MTVNQDATATKVSSSVSPSVYGQAVTFTATVAASSPGTGSPTGAVTFEDGSATLGTGSLSTTNGVTTASFSTAGLSVSSSHSIKAVYSGDPNFTTSTSSPLAQAVNQAATTTALAFSPANPTYGQSVTFTATVAASSPGAGSPTGTVTFKDGSTTLGTGILSTAGGVTTASFSTSSLAAGTHAITASYGGDPNFTGSAGSTSVSVLASRYVVTNTNDSGPGSLRQAILDANNTPGSNTISFNIAVGAIAESAPVPTANSEPWGIATGPDGNLWFIERVANQIGRLTPAGTLTEFAIPTANSNSDEITAGPDGNLWFTEGNGNKIGRITTAGIVTEFTIPTNSSVPLGITAGPDGNLWFTELGADKIGRITPTGTITEFAIPTVGAAPEGITAGPDGNLWFTEDSGDKIGRITITGTVTEFAIPTAGSNPAAITSGPDNNLWFTEAAGDKIGRITTTGTITEFNVPTPSAGPQGITRGPDGKLWFTEFSSGRIGQITTSGTVTEFNIPTTNSGPFEITNGPDSNLWFAEALGNQIGRITVASSGLTISPATPLPAITAPMVIDGTTQPGFSGTPLIEIDGANAGTYTVGLTITAGNTTIKGLVINRFGLSAIQISSGGGDVIQGNYIGTDTTGTLAEPNGWGQTLAVNDAVVISSSNNLIGGTTAAARNVISGNDIDGVLIFGGSNNQVLGNDIGTDVSGTHNLGNAYTGIRIEGSNNTIGGTVSGAGNVVSGNKQYGVFVTNGSPGNVIQGNKIGTDVSGKVAIGNVGYGVLLATSVYNDMVGGTVAGAGNVVAYNGSTGVFIGQPDQGLPLPGTGNGVLGNEIFANGDLGIALAASSGPPSGPLPNHSGSASGPNNLQNYPVLASAVTGPNGTVVQGTLNSTASTTFRIEFFSNTAADPSGYGEGQDYLGYISATTDSQGNATFQTTLSSVPAGQFISATATDPGNNTSEFCKDLVVSSSTATASFLERDTTTEGNWIGAYGAQGYDIEGFSHSLPSFATVNLTGASTYTWASTTTDPRGLLNPPSGPGRSAQTWYSPGSFKVDLNLTDGQAHDLELYLLDWDSTARAETVQVTDAASGTVLVTQSVSSFHGGVYLDYRISGHVAITITRTAGANAVLSGLFLDPAPPTTSATFLKQDAATQGTWIGTYGTQGYDVIGEPASLPSYATVTPSGQSTYTWAASTTDVRALQVPGGGSRIAATWYSASSFKVDLNLTDGQKHDLELYFLDWDTTTRAESVQISDATTGAVLSTQAISSFHNGIYLDYAVSGNILITITKTAGANAVLSGLFLDPKSSSTAAIADPTMARLAGRFIVQPSAARAPASLTGTLEAADGVRPAAGSGASSPETAGPLPRVAAKVDSPDTPAGGVSTRVTTIGPRPDGNVLRAATRRLARRPGGMVGQGAERRRSQVPRSGGPAGS